MPTDPAVSSSRTSSAGRSDVELEAAPNDAHPQDGSSMQGTASSREATPPPLPPRHRNLSFLDDRPTSRAHSRTPPQRPALQSQPTTAVSRQDVHTLSHGDGHWDGRFATSQQANHVLGGGNNQIGNASDDTASVQSLAPTSEAGGDVESLLGEVLAEQDEVTWKPLASRLKSAGYPQELFPHDPEFDGAFEKEFDVLDELQQDESNQDVILRQWRSKLKHFLILSSAGKPIYSRHGDDRLIANYIGIVQTIISFYQDARDSLRSFTTTGARFAIMTNGPLNLIAISRMGESDAQLRVQLDSLYTQILSTLTLPQLERIFSNRPSTDLRRPLQGTDTLLSALADGFTRGSPTTLLSSLECLKLRKAHRHLINNTLLKVKAASLLYGLIVAGGRLVSVVRPKKHSLHPGDLHLIFNMLFEAGSVKAGEGENWIPLCLPGFNNTGFVNMYVSFLATDDDAAERGARRLSASGKDDEVAIILISANNEGFYELRQMRDDFVEQLESNGMLQVMRTALRDGRPMCTDIIPGTVLRHFLYKSRANVQFTMPAYRPYFNTPVARRRLFNHYSHLHDVLHSRPTPTKLHHALSSTTHSLAWTTPVFELYAIAPASTSRAALAAAANQVVLWAKREESRIFIIGGGVF